MDHWIRVFFYLLIVRPFLSLVIGIRVKGRENLHIQEQVLIVSNHNSHLDTVVLLDLIGTGRMSHFRPVAAADYFESSRSVSFVTKCLFNILPIHRKGRVHSGEDPLEIMAQAIEGGDSLILFPEGTRGEPEKLARFRHGAGRLISRFPGLKVIPVFLDGMGRILPKGAWYPVPFIGRVNIGPPTCFRGTAEEITLELEAMVHKLGRECRGEPEPE
jgi:1-acyl-sn-glycerol-3-phosphate acyltransferase